MRIGVLSDTHLREPTEELKKALEVMGDVDLIVHCGDIVSLDVIEFLKRKAPVKAVCGNMDPPEVAKALPKKLVFEVEGVRIGVTHGYGAPWGIEERVRQVFSGEELGVIIFGHTHNPVNRKIGDVLFFNPGSPTDKFYAQENTLGILEVEKGKVEGRILKL